MFADLFTVVVRTGVAGAKGLSFLLIERSMPGVETKQMQCTGVWASGTAFVTFTDVKARAPPLLPAPPRPRRSARTHPVPAKRCRCRWPT